MLPATTTAVATVSSTLPTSGVTAPTPPRPAAGRGESLAARPGGRDCRAHAVAGDRRVRLVASAPTLKVARPTAGRHQPRTGARWRDAAFYVSDQVSGPITFGNSSRGCPSASICGMPAHVQEAIACHELLHVRRRDWLHEIFEETVVAVLWFHPAVWMLIGRIRLAREQVVDEATIQLTDSRERYVESLLAVARARLFPSFSPASPFLRRHLLKKRVARILQESTMTTRKLIASLSASAAALALAATFAVRSFPLEAQGRMAATSDEPIQLVQGGEHLLHGARPEYPRRAIEQKVEGDVQVEMTLNERGEVSDARVLSGPEELRKATLESVLQWHYSPGALASTVTQATLRFHVPPGGFEEEKKKALEALDGLAAQVRARTARLSSPARDRGGTRRSGHDDRQAGRVEDDGREDPRGAGSFLRSAGWARRIRSRSARIRSWGSSKDRLDSCRCEPSACQPKRRKK